MGNDSGRCLQGDVALNIIEQHDKQQYIATNQWADPEYCLLTSINLVLP